MKSKQQKLMIKLTQSNFMQINVISILVVVILLSPRGYRLR